MSLRIADFFIGTLSGALMAFCSHLAVSPSLNMLLGMLLGGLIGMSLMMILMVILMPFFGAFEVIWKILLGWRNLNIFNCLKMPNDIISILVLREVSKKWKRSN